MRIKGQNISAVCTVVNAAILLPGSVVGAQSGERVDLATAGIGGRLAEQLDIQRGEYETTSAYRTRAAARLGTAPRRVLLPSVATGSPCAATYAYDADAGALNVSLAARSITWTPPANDTASYILGDAAGLLLDCSTRKTGTYVGRNAYGTAARVNSYYEHNTVVAIPGVESGAWGTWRVPMNTSAAQVIRPRLRLVAEFQPVIGPDGKAVGLDGDVGKATVARPVDVTITVSILWAPSVRLRLVDGRSGAVWGDTTFRAPPSADTETGSATHPVSAQTYFDFQVEKQAALLSTLAPRYPAVLAAQGVEGSVTAQFVVDTTGAAEMGSWKVLESSNELFSQAAKESVRTARFAPAEVGGRKVRQLVQRVISFHRSANPPA